MPDGEPECVLMTQNRPEQLQHVGRVTERTAEIAAIDPIL